MRRILLCFVMLWGCHTNAGTSLKHFQEMDTLTVQFVDEWCDKGHLTRYGETWGGFSEIEDVNLGFISHRRCDLSEARKLFVTMTEDLLTRINNSKTLRPYLHTYPFTEKQVKIDLYFEDEHRKRMDNGKITTVDNIDGTVFYDIATPRGNWEVTIHQESYEEARKLVLGGL